MKVAEVARRRGHNVTILERGSSLGGQVRLAQRQPEHQAIAGVADYLEATVKDLGVEIRLRVSGTPERIASEAPEVVVIATGSEPNLPDSANRVRRDSRIAFDLGRIVLPDIPGLDLPFVYSSDEVLSGAVRLSGKIVLIDFNGHWEAAGAAEYLADCGGSVEIVTPDSVVGSDIEAGTRTLFYRRAAIKGIAMRTGWSLKRIAHGRVEIAPVFSGAGAFELDRYLLVPGDAVAIENVDAVVAVIGRRSREDIYHQCRSSPDLRGVRVERVGDCVAPRLLESNIAEAHQLALTL